MIGGVLVTPLKRIAGPSGGVLHAHKVSAPGYAGFGEAYFSEIHEGAVKSWRRHKRVTMNLVVPRGNVLFVFHDEDSGAFASHRIGEDNYARLTVPPALWMAFRGEGPGVSLILDIIDGEHDPTEADIRDLSAIAYGW
jgi:dTDP-4-dehydrorhamnose 3,5-epimerase